MAAVPKPMHALAQAIYGLYERREAEQDERPYLGCSVLGEPCARRLWLGFRWIARERFDGRMLRLFERGHREEAWLIEDMRAAGLTVWDRQADGRQFGVQALGGHVRGHMDAVVLGLPEAPKTPHLWDAKTIASKKFAELQRNGFRKQYPKYWAQAQMYMNLADLDRAVFMFVVKDTDEIHVERVERDRAEFDRLIKRAESVVFASEPPPKISNDPAWFECKFCHFHAHCHGSAAPAATCRTCAHVTPERDGTWTCERHTIQLSEDVQRQGCTEHRVIPILLANWAEQKDVVDGAVVYRNTLTGNTFMNGPRPDGYSSDELAACEDKRVIGEPDMKAFRDQFSGRVVA